MLDATLFFAPTAGFGMLTLRSAVSATDPAPIV